MKKIFILAVGLLTVGLAGSAYALSPYQQCRTGFVKSEYQGCVPEPVKPILTPPTYTRKQVVPVKKTIQTMTAEEVFDVQQAVIDHYLSLCKNYQCLQQAIMYQDRLDAMRAGRDPDTIYVPGYYRTNGTYVKGHYKTKPNSTKYDNLGCIYNGICD